MEQIQVMGVQGLPLIHAGDDIAAMICERVTAAGWRYSLHCLNNILKIKRLHKTSRNHHPIRTGTAAREPEW